MQIFINDEPIVCQENSTITSLLSQQNIHSAYIAVALNERVIPQAEWPTTQIPDGGRIIIIKAMQGG